MPNQLKTNRDLPDVFLAKATRVLGVFNNGYVCVAMDCCNYFCFGLDVQLKTAL